MSAGEQSRQPLHALLIRVPETLYQQCLTYSLENNVSIAFMARVGLVKYLDSKQRHETAVRLVKGPPPNTLPPVSVFTAVEPAKDGES